MAMRSPAMDASRLRGMHGVASPGDDEYNVEDDDDYDDEDNSQSEEDDEEDDEEEEEEEEYNVETTRDDDDEEEEEEEEEEEGDDDDNEDDEEEEEEEEEDNDDDSDDDSDEDDDEDEDSEGTDSDTDEDDRKPSTRRNKSPSPTRSITSSSRKSTSRTDALFEHANWKARKLQEKRAIEDAKFSYKPQTNTNKFRTSGGGQNINQNRLSVHDRLYTHGQRKRTASLSAKRAEIDQKEQGAFSKYTKKPGYERLENRVPAAPIQSDDNMNDEGVYNDMNDGTASERSSRSGHGSTASRGRFGPSGGMPSNNGGDRARSASSTRSSTRRTDALYLESILRQQRRQAKLRDLETEHTFQPDLSRGRSSYKEPFEKVATRSNSVHERLYDDGSKQRSKTQDNVAKIYSRSRVARNRRIQEYGMEAGEVLDQNGDFLDEWETKSLGGMSAHSSSSATHTQRTDALYLEATLRRARREEKARRLDPNLTFQPRLSSRENVASANGDGLSGRYQSASEASGVSRHDLLYLDGERKRQRNIDSRLDPNQRGQGELVGEYNKNWGSGVRGQKFNPLLVSRDEDNLNRRNSRDDDGTRSLDGFSVASDRTGKSGRSHTRRTEALYLEASLRAARKEAMREAYADQGYTHQPSIKENQWSESRSVQDVVSRLYNPAAIEESKAAKEESKARYEMKDYVGKPSIKELPVKSHANEKNAFERLHKQASLNASTMEKRVESFRESEKKENTFAPKIYTRKASISGTSTGGNQAKSTKIITEGSWVPKKGAATTNPEPPSVADKQPSRASQFLAERRRAMESSTNGASKKSLTPHGTSSGEVGSGVSGEGVKGGGGYDVMTGRSNSSIREEGKTEVKPLTALERFRLRQAERAKKREEEAAQQEALEKANANPMNKYRSFKESAYRRSSRDEVDVSSINPLLADTSISTH